MKRYVGWMRLIIMGSVLFLTSQEAEGTLKCWTLTEKQVEERWKIEKQGSDAKKSLISFEQMLSQETYQKMFPERGGPQCPKDYYSYQNLKDAIQAMGQIGYKVIYKKDRPMCYQMYRFHKATMKQTFITESPLFSSKWLKDVPVETVIIDFDDFLTEGNSELQKQELLAFLANIAHETSAGNRGLYYNEELSYAGKKSSPYTAACPGFGAIAGRSYHGRGPMQLTWNYNYGLVSAIIYGDPKVLLYQPELLAQDGKVGFMSAIAFWMMPQGNKISCHEAMLQKQDFSWTCKLIYGSQTTNQKRQQHYQTLSAQLK